MEFAIDIRTRCYLSYSLGGKLPVAGGCVYLRLFHGGRYGVFRRIFRRIFQRIPELAVDRGRNAVRRLVFVADLRELLPGLLGLTLPVPHTGIKPAGCQKPGMGAALGDAALV